MVNLSPSAAPPRLVSTSRSGRHYSFLTVSVLALLAGCGSLPNSPESRPPVLPQVTTSNGAFAGRDGGVAGDRGATSADGATVDPITDPENAIPAAGEGTITLAGAGESGNVDGVASIARFHNPTNVTLGPDGNVYVADFDNGVIRLVRPSGMTLTFTRQQGFSHPFGLAFAPDGTLYVQTDSDDMGNRDTTTGMLWRIDRRTGVATPLVRNLGRPRGLAVLPDGRLVMADNEHHVVRLIDPVTLAVTELAGMRDSAGYADGPGPNARFDHPYDVVLVHNSVIVVADQGNHRLRAITLQGDVSTYAGTGIRGSNDGARGEATFNRPQGLAADSVDNVFVTDMDGYVVRRVSPEGAVTTVAGTGRPGFSDGEPMNAQFFGLEGIDVSRTGSTIYVADGNRGGTENNHRIRRIGLATPNG